MGLFIEEASEKLISEWNKEKNTDIDINLITSGSGKKVWWKCEKGHEWEARISHRTNMKCNCPYCSGARVLAGFNDLQTKYPELAEEWHPTKNGNLKPTDITCGSSKKVWWLGKCGHEWEASISNRTGLNSTGCPYCSGSKALIGFNDLQSQYPDIAKEWHPTKNGDLKSTDVTSASGKKVWWLGKCGHEWEARVCDRVNGRGCGYCANRILLTGFNDLQTKYPELAEEWHPVKNGDLNPTDVISGSNKKFWWICQFGHEWKTSVAERINHKTGCPFCSGRRTIVGMNDLQTKCPDISKEWNYEKNGDLKPTEVSYSSNKKVWWKCSKGHEWKTLICDRTGRGKTGCPYCSNRKIIPGYNDLATISPNLVVEWNFEKNKGLVDGNGADISSPDKVSPVSGSSVWWKCDKGHEWKAKISNRTNGDGCPYCSNAGTSFPEQSVAFYIEQVCKIEQRIKIVNKEIDVYLPEYKIGVAMFLWLSNQQILSEGLKEALDWLKYGVALVAFAGNVLIIEKVFCGLDADKIEKKVRKWVEYKYRYIADNPEEEVR